MRLKGHSGCGIHFMDDLQLVDKYTQDGFPPNRLNEQALKQEVFYSKYNYSTQITTPKIYGIIPVNTELHVIMQMVDGFDFIEFSAESFITVFYEMCKKIISIIRFHWNAGKDEMVAPKVFVNKFNQVISQLDNHYAEQLLNFWSFYKPSKPVLVRTGWCHGDYTLSNMMVDNDGKLILLDFMDTFISSPMQDIAKLRQDTMHQWTISRYPILLKQMVYRRLRNFDNMIQKQFPNMPEYNYNLFQFFNLARILPYAKDKKTREYVMTEIRKIGEY